jgi:glyoxylase-like metal-dependent hydrolase (beta-lactamase superfamily II)
LPTLTFSPHLALVGRGRWGGLDPLSNATDANAYLLQVGDEGILIDCGGDPSCEVIAGNVRDAGVEPERVRWLILTHVHCDHSAAAASWQQRYGVQVACHSAAAEELSTGNLRLTGVVMHPEPIEYEAPRIDRRLAAGDGIGLDDTALRVRHTPGHVPDQICLRGIVDGVDTLFSGDCAIGNQGDVKGCIGWLDGYWGSDIQQYANTLDRLLDDPPERLLPGHGVPITGRAEVLDSLKECRRRLQYLLDIPDVGTMLPLTKSDPSYE